MSTLQQVKTSMRQAWSSLVEGWQHLYQHANQAITRFTDGKSETEGQNGLSRNVGWGVLATEMFEDDDQFVVRMEAPGMQTDDFSIEIVENYLVIRGQKNVERERSQGQYHVVECAYGSFERALPLPEEVVAEGAQATYKRGILRVELPKSVNARRHKVNVRVH